MSKAGALLTCHRLRSLGWACYKYLVTPSSLHADDRYPGLYSYSLQMLAGLLSVKYTSWREDTNVCRSSRAMERYAPAGSSRLQRDVPLNQALRTLRSLYRVRTPPWPPPLTAAWPGERPPPPQPGVQAEQGGRHSAAVSVPQSGLVSAIGRCEPPATALAARPQPSRRREPRDVRDACRV